VVKIVTAPNPVLSFPAQPVLRVDNSVKKIIKQMKDSLISTTDPKGVGLAAPQIGKSLQIFLAKPTDKSAISVFINPKIIEKSSEQSFVSRPKKDDSKEDSKKLEGCLSLPNIWGPVLRADTLTLAFLDELGKAHQQKFKGFMSTIIQHEMDHLVGILFPKRVLEQQGTLYKSHKNKKGEDEFEEIEI
jgi:peptide deformylase